MSDELQERKRSRYRDWLRAGRPKGRSSSPGRDKNFPHVVQTASGVYQASYPVDTGGPFFWGKAVGALILPLTSI
jgi:hypothetical protein